jgi:hypothetical protein
MKWKEKLRGIFPSPERTLKTVWKAEKGETVNYLVGTAHFFPYRFRKSLELLIRRGNRALFEGPMDAQSQSEVVGQGSRGEGSPAIYDALSRKAIQEIKKKTGHRFAEDSRPILVPFASKEYDALYQHFSTLRPWLAFFNIWTLYLREKGWKYSVDLEALEIATRMGKEVHYLETIEEQVAAMEKIPVNRIIHFLRQAPHWDEYTRAYVQIYLGGPLPEIMSQSSDFPSRCPAIIEDRDPLMFARMMPFFARGDTIAFVGTPHVVGLKKRLEREGYRVTSFAEPEEEC